MQWCPHCQFPLLRATEACGWCGMAFAGSPQMATLSPTIPRRASPDARPLPMGKSALAAMVPAITLSDPSWAATPPDEARMTAARWFVLRVVLRGWNASRERHVARNV